VRLPLELTGLTKVFETPSGPFVAVKDVNAGIRAGEFVAVLGHSGCGKSTVLSIIAGLERATYGGVVIDGTEVVGPGAERAIVFQSPCLLPWLTARENVRLAAAQRPGVRARELGARADHYLALAGVDDTAHQLPAQLSLGTQQCVSLARALSLEPRFLLLDEPFSQLDSLTRFELQDVLLRVWEESDKTVIMVTHDVDEALYLADRLLLMTDGPEATVGDSLTVPFARPRRRAAVLAHPEYHRCRRHVIEFLEHHAHQSRPSALDDQLRRHSALSTRAGSSTDARRAGKYPATSATSTDSAATPR
jgi:nitrate/nitrite transport system ATP-binding protein